MKKTLPQENTGLVLALAAGIAAAFVAMAWIEGVFAKLPQEVLLALAVFGAAFAVTASLIDPLLRALLARAARRILGRRPLAQRKRGDLARARPLR
jgi:hypothetical protein